MRKFLKIVGSLVVTVVVAAIGFGAIRVAP